MEDDEEHKILEVIQANRERVYSFSAPRLI